MKKKQLLSVSVALLVTVGFFGGLLWWLSVSDSSEAEDCIYLSDLSDDELLGLLEERLGPNK